VKGHHIPAQAAALRSLSMHPIKAREIKPAERRRFWDMQKFFLKNPMIRIFLVLVFFYQAFHSLATLFISFVIQDFRGTTTTVSIMHSFAALIEIIVFFHTDRLIARCGELPLIFVAILAQVARWLLVFKAHFLGTFFLIQALHPITFGIFYCCAVSFMNKHAPSHYKASAQTMFGFVYFGLAGMLGNIIGGQIVELLGLRILYLFAALGACIALALLFRLKKEIKDFNRESPTSPQTALATGHDESQDTLAPPQ
jgi:PPP family 3-phenylpropionic acid transporter